MEVGEVVKISSFRRFKFLGAKRIHRRYIIFDILCLVLDLKVSIF